MDIDIDSADRTNILKLIKNTPATIIRKDEQVQHNTGVYVNPVPVNPITGRCTLDHRAAEDMGYIKLDFLNMSVYEGVTSEEHLDELMDTEPDWSLLDNRNFVEQLIHINRHYDTIHKMPEPVDSIPRMAMMLSVIRPAKKHLIGETWKEVAKTVWDKPADDSYHFKQSHAVSYAILVAVHMNLLTPSFSQE